MPLQQLAAVPLALPVPLEDMAHALQLSVAPVFLLTGIAQLLNLFAGRLARVIDRARLVEEHLTPVDHPKHAKEVRELGLLDRRIRWVSAGIFLFTCSAIAIALLVAGLFVAALAKLGFARVMACLFICAMLLLIAGLICFLVEARMAIRTVRVPIHIREEAKRNRFR